MGMRFRIWDMGYWAQIYNWNGVDYMNVLWACKYLFQHIHNIFMIRFIWIIRKKRF